MMENKDPDGPAEGASNDDANSAPTDAVGIPGEGDSWVLDPAAEGAAVEDPAAEDLPPEPATSGKIKFESTMQRSEAVLYFRALVDGLDHGQLQFKQGDDSLSLAPSDSVTVEVKAAAKGGKQKVTFDLSWRTDRQDRLDING